MPWCRQNAWKIPEAVADQYAVMIEPFTIAANVTGHGQPTENDTVLVYGAGPIGLTIVQVLKGVYNVKNVIVADRIDERLEKRKRAGQTGRLITARHRLARFSLKRHKADINYRCGLSSFNPERSRNAGFSSGTYCIDGLLQ